MTKSVGHFGCSCAIYIQYYMYSLSIMGSIMIYTPGVGWYFSPAVLIRSVSRIWRPEAVAKGVGGVGWAPAG